jgi:hypothetical protein
MVSPSRRCFSAWRGSSKSDAFAAYDLDEADTATIIADVGTPTGWFGLVDGHTEQRHAPLAGRLHYAPVLTVSSRASRRLPPLLRFRARRGPWRHCSTGEDDDSEASDDDADEGLIGRPIPTETFLEALAQRFSVHPISLFSLLRAGIETGRLALPSRGATPGPRSSHGDDPAPARLPVAAAGRQPARVVA